MKKRIHITSKFLYFLSALLILVAAGLLAAPYVTNYEVGSYRPHVTRRLMSQTAHKPVSYNGQVSRPAGLSDSVKARSHGDVKVLGQMIAPHLHLPVDAGDGTNSMLLGAGTMSPGQQMGRGNYSLATHHMRNRTALFSPLYRYAHRGTVVWLTNDRQVYEYRIDQRKNVDETDTGVLQPTQRPTLTLITCQKTLGGRIRTVFIGHLVKASSYRRAPRSVQRRFDRPCNDHNVLAGY